MNQTDLTTNYIIDFARNVVNNGTAYLSGDDGNASEVGEDNNSENDLSKRSLTPSTSISVLKNDFDNLDHQNGMF